METISEFVSVPFSPDSQIILNVQALTGATSPTPGRLGAILKSPTTHTYSVTYCGVRLEMVFV